MLFVLCIAALLISLALLTRLAIIDLKIRLLPNRLVLGFAIMGILFHSASLFTYNTPTGMLIGALIGGGLLILIRCAGNFFYKQDTLGLGDVKLMAAAGLWLGPEHILAALIWGALAGLTHGGTCYGYERLYKKTTHPLSTYSIPAGPGFIVGILIAALAKFWPLSHLVFS